MTALEIHRGGADDPDGRRGRQLIVAARSGQVVRLAPGAYADGSEWHAADDAVHHRTLIEAIVPMLAGEPIVSHASAVVLHGLPWIGDFPERVTVTDVRRSTGQRRVHVDRVGGSGRAIRTQRIDGFEVTSLPVTAVDIALRSDRRRAIAVLDDVMRRGADRDTLLAELESRPSPRARVRARRLIEFASPLSGSVGESVSRLLFDDLGLPEPILQQRFTDRRGIIGDVDFWFPEQRVIVEFDGMVKYSDPRYRNGRSPEQVVIDEKLREDRLRAVPIRPSVARLVWREVMPGGSAPTLLRAVGLPMRSIARTVPRDR
jgi:hypothetical protein